MIGQWKIYGISVVIFLFLLTGCQENQLAVDPTNSNLAFATTETTETPPTETPKLSPTVEPIEWEPMEELYRYGMGNVYGMSASPDGEQLVIQTTLGVYIYRVVDGALLHFQSGEPLYSTNYYSFTNILWSPDGSMLAVGKRDNGIWIWDTLTWELLTEMESQEKEARNIPGFAWSPEGKSLALGDGNKTIWLWDVEKNAWEARWQTGMQQISLVWYQSGQLAMVGGDGYVFDIESGNKIFAIWTAIDGF